MSSRRAAAAQAAPALLDARLGLERACSWIRRAGGEGASLVVFPEAYLPGYPFWVDGGIFGSWDHGPSKHLHAALVESSVEVPSDTTDRLGAAAKEAEAVVVIGINERDGRRRTLWNSLLTFDADGRLVGHHRKLVPTFGERLVWTPGDAAGLRVHETAAGRVGGLICWEHWMPAPRQVLHDGGEVVHAASWPHVREDYLLASRHYAFEGRCFVVAAGMVLGSDDLPENFPPEVLPTELRVPGVPILVGGSCIIGPDGRVLAGPAGEAEERLVVADLDLARVQGESLSLDTGGHYARPDLFRLSVDRRRPGTVSEDRTDPAS